MNSLDNSPLPDSVAKLIDALAADDPVSREAARDELVRLGDEQVTRALVGELTDPRRHVRWEAAKALGGLADPISAPALLHAMEDDDQDVRWVAGEGLIGLGDVGLRTVFSGLTRRARSIEFCKAAHHVLHELKRKGRADIIDPVLKSLETSEPEVAAPVAAYDALVALKAT